MEKRTGKVNAYDKTLFLESYNSAEGNDRYNSEADYMEDGKINSYDKTIFLANWNNVKTIEE